jgi:VTC domain
LEAVALMLVNPLAHLESPSLSASAGLEIPAYELKFLLTEAQAREVEERARRQMFSDPHADPAVGNAYRITSLYCDTPAFDVFHRLSPFQRRKHRLRRYGQAPWVFLERKIKWGDRVKKRRTMIPDGELSILVQPPQPDRAPAPPNGLDGVAWPGHWFHRHLAMRQLAPVCRIAYERVALVGEAAEGPLRLTFDRHIRGQMHRDWNLDDDGAGMALFTDQVICEFKYRGMLPALFKEIILAARLTPGPVSKYRAFLRASGFVDTRRAADA